MHVVCRGQIAGDALEAATAVGCFEKVRAKVVEHVTIESYISNPFARARRFDARNGRVRGKVRHVANNVGPVFSAIRRDLQIAVIRSRPNLTFLRRGLGETNYCFVILGARVFDGYRSTGILLFVSIVRCQIGTDLFPARAKVR